jgi:peroxiredoxin
MTTSKLAAGAAFPALEVEGPDGQRTDIGKPRGDADWTMVVVYRGRHCPLCTRYLNELEAFLPRLTAIGVDIAAVSADSAEQLAEHRERLSVSFPLYHGMTLEQMQSLGLYISHPRSPKETDHPFAEPGLFVINAEQTIQVVDLSNNPFVRPALEQLVSGLEWIRNPENNYPIRGTWPQQAA